MSRACCNYMRVNGLKLNKRIRLRYKEEVFFFIMRLIKHQNRLPRESVNVPSLETFKVRLDRALSNLM